MRDPAMNEKLTRAELKERFPNASEQWLDLNASDLEDTAPDRVDTTGMSEDRIEELEEKFQAQCEKHLIHKGYGRRTPKGLVNHGTRLWMVHLAKPKGNPMLLDLLLLNAELGRYIEIELKIKGGRLSPEQQALVFRKDGVVVWSFEEFVKVVTEWEVTWHG